MFERLIEIDKDINEFNYDNLLLKTEIPQQNSEEIDEQNRMRENTFNMEQMLEFDISKMLQQIKADLEYCTTNF